MNILPIDKRVRIVSALVEGCSLRSTARMVGVSVNTVMKFVADFGPVCEEYHDQHVRNVNSKRVQCDEIWAFCYANDKNLPERMRGMPGVGSVWTWTALDSDSHLMVSWMVGDRDAECAGRFMKDLSERIAGRCQLTTDGHAVYERAVCDAFGWQIDYAMLVKLYGDSREAETRYSLGECIGTNVAKISGRHDDAHLPTTDADRLNLTTRGGMRRLTRLTSGVSKKLANHRAAIAIHFMHYNFCRVHKTPRATPAMEAELAEDVWELEHLVGLLETHERSVIGTEANKRGPYNTRRADIV